MLHNGRLAQLAACCALFGSSFHVVPCTAEPRTQPYATWHARYARARNALLEERYEAAARSFRELALEAPTDADRRVTLELADVAEAGATRQRPMNDPSQRTSDELSLLYTSAFIYGLGSGAWTTLLTKPGHLAPAVLPFIGFTTASVGGIAVADRYRPLRRGVPQAISTGLYLGLGQGIWIVGYQHARSSRQDSPRWSSAAVATALWSTATLGAVAGGLVGSLRRPTPGRASFTGSSAFWGGIVAGFSSAAFTPDRDRRGEAAFAGVAVGYNVGLISGLVLAPTIAPSVARMRFVDLSGLGGGLLACGGYISLAGERSNARAALGTAALGTVAGLSLGFWLTDGMAQDSGVSSDRANALNSLRLSWAPTPHGWLAQMSGEL